MNESVERLFTNNRSWSEGIRGRTPDFFERLAAQQSPEFLWIGCADSRVPANQIIGVAPGEVFVHRNVANVVVPSDLNCLSVIQYAIEVLKVKHVFVVGHLGCGGVRAALNNDRFGLIDNWLRHVQNVRDKHAGMLAAIPDAGLRSDRLCVLNVIEQVMNVCQTSVLLDAWSRKQDVTVHGWVYALRDGLIRDLQISIDRQPAINDVYASALKRLATEPVERN